MRLESGSASCCGAEVGGVDPGFRLGVREGKVGGVDPTSLGREEEEKTVSRSIQQSNIDEKKRKKLCFYEIRKVIGIKGR